MSRQEALRELESRLEQFLEGVVRRKASRLDILGGINSLDDIARAPDRQVDLSSEVGNWFASHNRWLSEQRLRPGDSNRINSILGRIRDRLTVEAPDSPASRKIATEIDRWRTSGGGRGLRIVLKRGSEAAPVTVRKTAEDERQADSLQRFRDLLIDLQERFEMHAESRKHILSALDDALDAAEKQNNREALILSALMIYYLKQDDYKIDPYVARLRAAERRFKGGAYA